MYGFADGKITPEKMMQIPLQQLAAGRKTMLRGWMGTRGCRFRRRLRWCRRGVRRRLLVADNLSDDVLLMDAASGAVVKRFDL